MAGCEICGYGRWSNCPVCGEADKKPDESEKLYYLRGEIILLDATRATGYPIDELEYEQILDEIKELE